MSFTILYAAFALLVLIVIFGLTYKIKGLKTAIVTTGIAFTASAIFFVALIYAIVTMMPK